MSSNSTGCYWPDGSEATNYWPCPHTPSMCCDEGDFCLTAKICQKQGNTSFYRGACSSQNWNATGAGCPQFFDFYSAPCLDSMSGPVTIAECVGESSSEEDWYICSNGCFNSSVCAVGLGAENDMFPMEAVSLSVGLFVLIISLVGLFFALRARRRQKEQSGNPIPEITVSQELDGTEKRIPPANSPQTDVPESPFGTTAIQKSASTSISSAQQQPVSPLSNSDRLSEMQGGDETRRVSEMPDWGWLESRRGN
ncbi:hypothetical protein B0T22DRAFT_445069 [Podospora appendiculata]|uniref:Uncharacterized protein n=1 Tax=Podospora appendiculata TaxID=314037 RepID=A0AAE1C8M3_9PEZI|nr:hypothetical protein B0T22DRAFT_445069 [Podospora appendiculata]